MSIIYIYIEKPTSEDRSRLYKIFSFLNIPQENIRIIDISIEDIDPVSNLLIFTIGRNPYAAVRRSFIDAGIYSSKSLLGQGDIFEESLNFYWSYTPHTVTEIFTNESVKEKVWNSLCSLAKYYETINNLNSINIVNTSTSEEQIVNTDQSVDNNNNDTSTNCQVEDFNDDPALIHPIATSIDCDDLPWAVHSLEEPTTICEDAKPEIVNDSVDPIEIVEDHPVVNPENSGKIQKIKLSELADIISQNLDLSDPGIGKSFSLLEKVELTTKSGKLIIYPTGERIKPPDKDATHLSLKDALSLVRMAAAFGANEVSFHQKAD